MAEFDANNNSAMPEKAQEKYSLRPRAALKREEPDDEHEDGWKPSSRGRSTKRRQKPKPLSRYRRKTANARERSRMREINEAFEALRRAVPHLAVDAHNEKLTKITTLRLAMKYISALNGLLTAPAATAVASPASAAAASATAADTRCDDGRAAAVSACLAAMAGGCGGSSVASETTASSVSSDVDSLLGEYTTAADLLSECSSGTPPGFLDHFGGGFRDVMCAGGGPAYSLSPSSCSTADVGFPSLLAAADFADAAAFMQPFSDHPLPPIDFNGDPYIFEDNFATEFS